VSLVRLILLALACGSVLAAQETDKRLHADGKGWGLDKAKITDTKLPRVLLIGDSILNGYRKEVIASLAGKAYVDAWVNPYCQSEHYNKLLADVLDKNGPYNIVHFNMGLHGWPKGRIKEGTFEPLTKAYIAVIKQKGTSGNSLEPEIGCRPTLRVGEILTKTAASQRRPTVAAIENEVTGGTQKLPKAKIIWASSTPVTVKGNPTELDPEINPIIVEHNRMAANVMKEMNVPVNDFYSLLVNKLDLARGDQFHWKPDAYKILAQAATDSILRELKRQ